MIVVCKEGRNLMKGTLTLSKCYKTVALDAGQKHTKPLADMPSPPAWPLLGHLPLMMKKENMQHKDKLYNQLREDYGDIFKLCFPGKGPRIFIFRPEDIETLYKSAGRLPHMASFEMFEYIRKTTMKDRYVTAGLLNNGEDWYEFRQKVQQDMMRPKSALYYTSSMTEIAMELTEKIAIPKNNDGIVDPYQHMQEYTLEAVGCILIVNGNMVRG